MGIRTPDATSFTAQSISDLYLADEAALVAALIRQADLDDMTRDTIGARARSLAKAARKGSRRAKLIDQFLREYGLSTHEGVTLMRLCEALIRTPDAETSNTLVRDKIGVGGWAKHIAGSTSFLVNLSTRALQVSSVWITSTGGKEAQNLAAKLGDGVLRQAMQHAMAIMGDHFVLGATIESAMHKAQAGERAGYVYSYDMLGEAAYTEADAARYFAAYEHAIQTLAAASLSFSSIDEAPGISVKLSALHPRYEYAQRARCVPDLVERLTALSTIAKSAGISLTIDAEEADRLETSLDIFNQLLETPDLAGWDGLGIVIQAYQRRATAVIDEVVRMARTTSHRIPVRLVKGAYWDMEIKRAQELGLVSYPVFTRKENTDVSYLACARKLFAAGNALYPQFATHNAHTVAAVMHMAGDRRDYEFQRLHGMGETLHEALIEVAGVRSRIYAPVGQHKDLLPYLVRRLLENGANSSFVNQLLDPGIEISDLVHDPIDTAYSNKTAQHPNIPDPRDQFDGERLAARGIDLTQAATAATIEVLHNIDTEINATSLIKGEAVSGTKAHVISPTDLSVVGDAAHAGIEHVANATAAAVASNWASEFPASERAACLRRAAQMLEERMEFFIGLCMKEAGKAYPDGVAEVREAVDFCRYYADQAETTVMECRASLGVVACISPWNFPLAIFLGQVTAALAAGNTVVTKPAEQTPLIAYEAVRLLHDAGIPKDALNLLIGDGAMLGSALVSDPAIDAVCFTGSTRTAKHIAKTLTDSGRPLTPFIAETGGLNAMIIDSTALLEQAVTDVVASAFQSAGQRCSACRFVCVQDDIAGAFIEMLKGAMDELQVGDPGRLQTDVGPVIDQAAQSMLQDYIAEKKACWKVIGETPISADVPGGFFVTPIAFEINAVSDLEHEVFGPVLHVVRFDGAELDTLIDEINGLGYGLTMGLHTRIDARVHQVAERARVGNLYVNRNQIGAVVGVQPFGGEGLSGTGPKAGGPHYLKRLSRIIHTDETAVETPQVQFTSPGTADPVVIENLRKAQTTAHDIDRAEIFERAASLAAKASLASADLLRPFVELIRTVYNHTQTLPGPTGETNTLRLAPRGVLLCVTSGNSDIDSRQLLLALASGNSVILSRDETRADYLHPLLNLLQQAGLPEESDPHHTLIRTPPPICRLISMVSWPAGPPARPSPTLSICGTARSFQSLPQSMIPTGSAWNAH